MNLFDICGYVAGIFFASCLIPQVYKSYKTKKLDDISYSWQFSYIFAIILSIIYSGHYLLYPILLSSVIEFVLMTALILMKRYYSSECTNDTNKENDVEPVCEP